MNARVRFVATLALFCLSILPFHSLSAQSPVDSTRVAEAPVAEDESDDSTRAAPAATPASSRRALPASASTPLASQPLPERARLVGVGMQVTLPTAGPSGIYNITESSSAQVILGMVLGKTRTVTGRYLHHLFTDSYFQPYLCAEIGGWSYLSEIVFGYGGGVGLEYFIERFPFVGISLEVTIRSVGFENSKAYDISGPAIGGGVHYYF